MVSIDSADRFLAQCARSCLDDADLPPWPEDWKGEDARSRIAARAEFHGIAGLLAGRLAGARHWPDCLRDDLQTEARLAGLWEEIHRKAIVRLIEGLANEGVPSVVMKGTALAYLYHPDPAARRRGDTDLLIRPADLERTRIRLAALGCSKREDPHGLFFQETWEIDCGAGLIHSLDLHWEAADRPILQEVLRSAEYWENPVPLPRLSPRAQAPSPVLLMVHGAINQAWHVARGFFVDGERIKGGRRLIWSVDYARLTEAFSAADWQRLVTLCHERKISPLVHAALAGAVEDLGLHLPAEPMARLASDTRPSPAADYIAAPDRLGDMLADIRAATSVGLKLRILGSMIFAPRSHLEDKFPHLAHWPSIALQLRRYVGAVAWLRRRGAGR